METWTKIRSQNPIAKGNTMTTADQLAYFAENRQNSLCVVNEETGKVFKTFPRTQVKKAIEWMDQGKRWKASYTMYDVKHKDGCKEIYRVRPELTARERAAERSRKVNGEPR